MSRQPRPDHRPYNRYLTGDERTQVAAQYARQYEAGDSIRAIAEREGRSYGTVHSLLTEAGVRFRPRGVHHTTRSTR